MKRTILLMGAMIASVATYANDLPEIKIQDQAGKMINVAALADGETPVIVSFWSTTCKPCMKELDAISEVYEEWNEESPFKMVAVSIDDSRSVTRAKALAKGRGWDDFTLLYDVNSDLKRSMNVVLTPQIFVFDKDGKQVYAHTGYTPGSEDELFDLIIELNEKK